MKYEYNENIGSDQLANATGTGSLGKEATSLEVYGWEVNSRAGERVVPGGNSSRMTSREGHFGWEGWDSVPYTPLPKIEETVRSLKPLPVDLGSECIKLGWDIPRITLFGLEQKAENYKEGWSLFAFLSYHLSFLLVHRHKLLRAGFHVLSP